MAALSETYDKAVSHFKQRTTKQFRVLCFDPLVAAVSVGLATLCGPIEYLVHGLYSQHHEQQHKKMLRRSIANIYKGNLKFYPFVLPVKDYIQQKMQKTLSKKTNHSNILTNIGINLVSPFVAAYIWSALFFNTFLPKVALVNMFVQQQKLRKYYKQNHKSNSYIWKQLIKRRNIGFFAHTFGVGVSNIVTIGMFDTAQMFLSQQAKYFVIPNILIATATNYLGNLIFTPFNCLSITKRKPSSRVEIENQIAYKTKPYRALLEQSWQMSRQNLKKRSSFLFVVLNLRGGLILAFYQRIKMYLYDDNIIHL